ncbi:hypothetical protein CTH30272_03279 [Allocatenococcus thiocycli]|nr:hypothetical protein CTH30272_03279 [Catenococcus thiocycli]
MELHPNNLFVFKFTQINLIFMEVLKHAVHNKVDEDAAYNVVGYAIFNAFIGRGYERTR